MIPPSLSPEHNKAITLHLGRIRDSVGLLFGLALILFGVWLITAHDIVVDNRIFGGIAACCLGGIIVLGSIVEILIYRLELNENLFRVHHIHFFYSFGYRWSDISRFSVARVCFFPVVGFNVHADWDDEADPAIEAELVRRRRGLFQSGYDHTLFMPFGLRHDELAEVLNEWRTMWKRERYYPCPCCGYYSFDDAPGSFENCVFCGWLDDELQLTFPHLREGFNPIPLIEAQKNFQKFGAVSKELSDKVEEPSEQDKRDPQWAPINGDDKIPTNNDLAETRTLWRGIADESQIYYWKDDYWFPLLDTE